MFICICIYYNNGPIIGARLCGLVGLVSFYFKEIVKKKTITINKTKRIQNGAKFSKEHLLTKYFFVSFYFIEKY